MTSQVSRTASAWPESTGYRTTSNRRTRVECPGSAADQCRLLRLEACSEWLGVKFWCTLSIVLFKYIRGYKLSFFSNYIEAIIIIGLGLEFVKATNWIFKLVNIHIFRRHKNIKFSNFYLIIGLLQTSPFIQNQKYILLKITKTNYSHI